MQADKQMFTFDFIRALFASSSLTMKASIKSGQSRFSAGSHVLSDLENDNLPLDPRMTELKCTPLETLQIMTGPYERNKKNIMNHE